MNSRSDTRLISGQVQTPRANQSRTRTAPEQPRQPRYVGDSLFKPETVGQAQLFETYKNRYVDVGLCHYCAAQAAYGHQHGFSNVEYAADWCCGPVIARLPNEEVNGWRSMDVHAYRTATSAIAA